ncbi:ATP-dependent translocase ABCB1-like [Drosophila montana]|uniref:ATP-dependent translocase ABCB1-like n=1 Tax=Drosophila montana TaxID=40370 RepID=UPI00313AE0C1
MTASYGNSVKDDDSRLSHNKTNIVLGQSFADKDKEHKSFEPNKRKKNSKHKEAADSDEDDKPKEEIKPVGFFTMFRYASKKDRILYSIGLICALGMGLTTPANSLIFGDLANDMINLSGLGQEAAYMRESSNSQALLDAVQKFSLNVTYIGLVMLCCSYMAITCFNYAAHSQTMSIRSKFFKSVLHQDMSWYDINQSGEVASRMNE